MSFLNARFAKAGGLKAFLKGYIPQQKFAPYTSAEFSAAMSQFFHADTSVDFHRFTEAVETRLY